MMMKIWIDADACPKPVKELVYKASARLNIPVVLVANSYHSVPGGLVTSIQVDHGADVADSYIVDHLDPIDLVITADIPLAGRVVEKGALAIDPRGETYDAETISERLSMRDFMQELRDSGVQTSGPAPYSPKDKESFANALNRILAKKVSR